MEFGRLAGRLGSSKGDGDQLVPDREDVDADDGDLFSLCDCGYKVRSRLPSEPISVSMRTVHGDLVSEMLSVCDSAAAAT